MKRERGGFRMLQHEQLMQELVHDSYHSKRKLPEPARGAARPACRRIRDRFPAGYVSLSGRFFEAHRNEVLHRVRSCEGAERADHPLQRIMAIEAQRKGTLVTTTDTHLARRIGVALHKAYKGELEFRYNKEDDLLRVSWSR